MDASMMNNDSMMGMMMACIVASALFALTIVIVVIIQAVIQAKILREVRELKDKAARRLVKFRHPPNLANLAPSYQLTRTSTSGIR